MSHKPFPMFFVAVKLVRAAQDIPPTPRTTSYENCVHISTGELQSCTDLGNSHNFGENASKMPNSVHFMALATEQASRSGLSFVMFALELVLSLISGRRGRGGIKPSTNGLPRCGASPRLVGMGPFFSNPSSTIQCCALG